MTEYHVNWAINIEADTPEDAAREALAIQRDPDSIATYFLVCGPDSVTHGIDLQPEIDEEAT